MGRGRDAGASGTHTTKNRKLTRHLVLAGAVAGTVGVGGLALAAIVGASGAPIQSAGAQGTASAHPGSPASSGPAAHDGHAGSAVSTTTTTTVPPIPRVVAISPANGAQGVGLTSAVKVLLSSEPRPGAPMPVLSPPVGGQWSTKGDLLTFVPSTHFQPWRHETLTVPAGLATPAAVDRPRPSGPPATVYVPAPASARAATYQAAFTTAGISTERSQQLLAELDYLPVRFQPAGGAPALAGEATTAAQVATSPRPGTFPWRFSNVPASLSAQWAPGQDNVVMRGAVMAFESAHGLAVDGVVGPQVWAALTAAVANREMGPPSYDYLMVTESLPEKLVVWQDGSYVYSAPANTGVPGATTATGTYPVYERFQSTTMVGTDVDGTHYDVHGVPWVAYFNGGDAVHGYWRSAFGYPQSNGCVELPISDARVVWNMDPIGTLVNVS